MSISENTTVRPDADREDAAPDVFILRGGAYRLGPAAAAVCGTTQHMCTFEGGTRGRG